jgi:uncharacterized phage protein (TIGR01671 family)
MKNVKNKREIKFRAWDGQYMQTDDFYVDSVGDIRLLKAVSGFSDDYFLNWEDGWKLMQYTGIHDKNGKEIYEGDILIYTELIELSDEPYFKPVLKTGIVNFSDGSFRITVDDCFHAYRWMDYECEVIGNIYENKDQM